MGRYTSTFPNDENPVSESGNWIAAYSFNRLQSVGGVAYGLVVGTESMTVYKTTSAGAQNSIATLGAFAGAQLAVVCTVCRATNLSGNQYHNRALAIRNDGSGHTTELRDCVNNSENIIASESATTWAANDTLELRYSGNTAQVYRNGGGSPLCSADSNQTDGYWGCYTYVDTGGTITNATIAYMDGGDTGAAFLKQTGFRFRHDDGSLLAPP